MAIPAPKEMIAAAAISAELYPGVTTGAPYTTVGLYVGT
jgi:hypothetical protein